MKPTILIMTLILTVQTPASARRLKRNLAEAVLQKVEEVAIKPPSDNEVCFSPKEPCDIKLLKFIETAEKSIDVAIYDINLDQIVHTLLLKSKKGVQVRIILDKRQAKEKYSLVPTLIKAGANLKYGHQRGIMHDKFIIIDSKRIETGSFNYTNHASTANNENQIYLNTPSIVERYQKQFSEMWAEAK